MSRRGTGNAGLRRRFNERGASAVEAAIVTPLVFALFFGILEMGFLFKDYLAVAGAVRAGVRVASANPRVSTFAQDAADNVAATGGAMNFEDVEQMWVYKVSETATSDKPFGKTNFNDCDIDKCVKFRWDVDHFERTGSEDWAADTQNACPTGRGGPPDRIGVYIELRHDAFTGFDFNTVTISEASIMTLEPMPVLTGCGP